jgi:hypothetical protein
MYKPLNVDEHSLKILSLTLFEPIFVIILPESICFSLHLIRKSYPAHHSSYRSFHHGEFYLMRDDFITESPSSDGVDEKRLTSINAAARII